jgi:hypothetical protein
MTYFDPSPAVDLPQRWKRRHHATDAKEATTALPKQGKHRGTPSALPHRQDAQVVPTTRSDGGVIESWLVATR